MSKPLAIATVVLSLAASTAFPRDSTAQDAERIDAAFDERLDLVKQDVVTLRARLSAPDLSAAEATRIGNLRANLARRADALWKSTLAALDEPLRTTRREILQFNEEARRLEFETVVIGSRVDLLNNLGTYPDRAEFDGNVARMSQDWERKYGARLRTFGADFDRDRADVFARAKKSFTIDLEADGFGRGMLANPYAPGTFARYFAAAGALSADEWEKDSRNWGDYRKSVEAARARRQDRRAALAATADRLNALRDRVVNARRTVGREIKGLQVPK